MVSTGPLFSAKSLWPRWFPFIKKLYQAIELFVLPRIDMIGVMDNVTYQRYVNMKFLCQEKLRWTWTAVDNDMFKPLEEHCKNKYRNLKSGNKITIAFAGRLDKVKNLEFLLHTYSLLEKSKGNIKLVLFGSGPEEKNLVTLASLLNLQNVNFFGEVPANEMPYAINSVDIIVLPAIGGEGSPTILKEALACGVPIVSMKVGDVEKFIKHPLTGKIVEDLDEYKFAQAIIEIISCIENDNEAVTLACQCEANNYSLKNFGHHWEDLIFKAQMMHLNPKDDFVRDT